MVVKVMLPSAAFFTVSISPLASLNTKLNSSAFKSRPSRVLVPEKVISPSAVYSVYSLVKSRAVASMSAVTSSVPSPLSATVTLMVYTVSS